MPHPRYEHYAKDNNLGVELDDRVATVTLDRPDRRNAFDYALHVGLEHVLSELSRDPEVGAIVLTGAGKAFSSGGDLKGFAPPGEEMHPLFELRQPRDLVQAMLNCEAPIIAAVNGPALGLGATVALLCDVIFAAEEAKIGDTHVSVGLVAGDGGAVIWPLLIGPHRAKELLMSGRPVSGSEAAAMGLVNHVVPGDRLLDEAHAFASELAHGAGIAIRLTKMTINRTIWQNLLTNLDFGLAAEKISSHSEDMKEAFAAFREKRKPVFKGR